MIKACTCGGNQAAEIRIGADMAIGPAIMFIKEPGYAKELLYQVLCLSRDYGMCHQEL